MDPRYFQILHVLGVLILFGSTFAAFANPLPVLKRKVLAVSGIASLVVLIAGFGLAGLLKYGFPGWIIIKIVCWLGLSAMAGIAYRQPKKIPLLAVLSLALVATAIVMVYLRPFT